jgi:hypothetical protein
LGLVYTQHDKRKEIDMEREYTYAELVRMTKKRVVRIAGYKNIKAMYKDGVGRTITEFGPVQDNLSKKYIAKLIASDR